MSALTPAHLDSFPVEGGALTYGTWGDEASPTVIVLHGVTGTHMDWIVVGNTAKDRLQIVAPDLRGRGGSSDIDGPWGMRAHAHDVIALMDHLDLSEAVLVGHSMGGFVAVLTAVLFPDRVRGLVLVDGGLPAVEANAGGDELTRVVLEAARNRLDDRFDTPEAYLAQMQATFGGAPLDEITQQILRYDLVQTSAGAHRIAGDYDAISADAEHIGGDASERALESLERPAILLRAGRGLPPREAGLYSPAEVASWTSRVDSLVSEDLSEVDHGTIMRDEHAIEKIIAHTIAADRA